MSACLNVIITSMCTSALQMGTTLIEISLYIPALFSLQLLYKHMQETEEIEKHLVCDPIS